MNHSKMLQKAMPQVYSVPDGYSGKMAEVRLALHEGNIIEIADCGYYRSPAVTCASSEEEVLWLVKHHPLMRDRYKLVG